MAKKKTSQKKKNLEKEYRRQRQAVLNRVRTAKKQGFDVSAISIPKIPKTITQGSIRALQKYTSSYINERVINEQGFNRRQSINKKRLAGSWKNIILEDGTRAIYNTVTRQIADEITGEIIGINPRKIKPKINYQDFYTSYEPNEYYDEDFDDFYSFEDYDSFPKFEDLALTNLRLNIEKMPTANGYAILSNWLDNLEKSYSRSEIARVLENFAIDDKQIVNAIKYDGKFASKFAYSVSEKLGMSREDADSFVESTAEISDVEIETFKEQMFYR